MQFVFAKFDEIPSIILQDIKETKRYGHTVGRSDNVKTVYPPTNTVCGGGGGGITTFTVRNQKNLVLVKIGTVGRCPTFNWSMNHHGEQIRYG